MANQAKTKAGRCGPEAGISGALRLPSMAHKYSVTTPKAPSELTTTGSFSLGL